MNLNLMSCEMLKLAASWCGCLDFMQEFCSLSPFVRKSQFTWGIDIHERDWDFFFFLVHRWITIIICSVCTKSFVWTWNHRKKFFHRSFDCKKKTVNLNNCSPKSFFIILIPIYPVPRENWQYDWIYQCEKNLTRFGT